MGEAWSRPRGPFGSQGPPSRSELGLEELGVVAKQWESKMPPGKVTKQNTLLSNLPTDQFLFRHMWSVLKVGSDRLLLKITSTLNIQPYFLSGYLKYFNYLSLMED